MQIYLIISLFFFPPSSHSSQARRKNLPKKINCMQKTRIFRAGKKKVLMEDLGIFLSGFPSLQVGNWLAGDLG